MKQKIREKLESLRGKKLKIMVDVGRNKNEVYEGFIDKLYNNVWTFKTKSDIKSFSYVDILIKSVILSPF